MENNIELGSEFNLDVDELSIVDNNLYSYFENYHAQWFDYGRSALRSLRIPKNQKVLLPEFICESVINCFIAENIVFYRIDEYFQIDIKDLIKKLNGTIGVIYIAHYFGHLQNKHLLERLRELANKYGCIIIEDITQSLFSIHNYYGDYVIGSVRKWMQTPQGGFMFSNRHSLPENIMIQRSKDNSRAIGMILKDLYLKVGYNSNLKYREIFANCENNIDKSEQIKKISNFAEFIIRCVNIDDVKKRRINNTKYLVGYLKEMGIYPALEFREDECPLVVPIRVNNRNNFRKYLMENKIYCAVHWPFDGFQLHNRSNAKWNAETLISLPIDQRYGHTEMDYMISIISRYGGGLSF